MRSVNRLILCGLLATSSCTPVHREKVADIGEKDSGVAYFLYRRGGTIDDFLTVEVRDRDEDMTLMSISDCNTIAVRKVGGKLDAVGFDARISVGEIESTRQEENTQMTIRTHNRAATGIEIQTLKQSGFTVLQCSNFL